MKSLLDREDSIFDPPRSGCVLCLTGLPGGDGKIYDRSPYGNIGTITGATWRPLPSGIWCLSFDGTDDFVDCGSGASLQITAHFTICLWMMTSDVTQSSAMLMTKEMTTLLKFSSSTGKVNTRMLIGGVDEEVIANTALTNDLWQQVVVTYDGSNVRIYIDGALDKTEPASGAVVWGTGTLQLGARKGSLEYTGNIALPRIHNRALSALEIQNLFSQEKHLFGVW